MSDRINRSEQIGDAVARSLDPGADAAKRAIWRKVAGVLDGVFDAKPLEINADPTSIEAYMPDGTWCFARTVAWQLDVGTGLPLALWVKTTDEPLAWEKLWPVEGADDDHLVKAYNTDATAPGGLIEKTTSSGGTTLQAVEVSGVQKLAIYSPPISTLMPKPVGGVADPGYSGESSDAEHVHGLVAPEDVGTKLFTAQVPDPLTKLSVDAVLVGPEGCALMWDAFTQIDSRTYKFFTGMPTAWCDGVTPFNGIRLLAWNNLTEDTHMERRVVYALTCEDPVTHPELDTLTVADDFPADIADVPENTHVTVGGGTAYNGYIFARKTENVLGWEPALEVVDSPTNELLDAQHLSRAATHDVYADLSPHIGEDNETGMLMLAYRSEQLSGVSFPIGSKCKAHLQLSMLTSPEPEIGTDWTTHNAAEENQWRSVCRGPDKYVAVAATGTTANLVMTSPDGEAWASQTSPSLTAWRSVCRGPDKYVAVSDVGPTFVMTSPDGEAWAAQTAPAHSWMSVCYSTALGLYVAVARGASLANRVMTSPDGEHWTDQVTPISTNEWNSVCAGPDKLVAVSLTGTGHRVMTSVDAENWVLQSTPADLDYRSVVYFTAMSIYVAVASSGTGNRVMTSPDGEAWTSRTSAVDHDWFTVCDAGDAVVAIAYSGATPGNRVMTSTDGEHWTARSTPVDNQWRGACVFDNKIVAVAVSGTSNRVMTSVPVTPVFEAIVYVGKVSSSDPSAFAATQGSGYSTAVTSTTPGFFDIDIETSGDVLTIGPDEYFAVGVNNVRISGTGSNILHFVYNDGPHSSYITLPVDLGLFGTKNHQQLTPESRGFSPAQVTEAATHTHPVNSLLPGLLQDKSTELTLGTYNVLSTPTSNAHWVGTQANAIYGMGVPTFEDGCTAIIKVYFTAETRVVHLASGLVGPPALAEQKQFHLTPCVAADPQTEFTYTFPAKSFATFEYVDAKWRLVDMTYPGFRQDRIITGTATAGVLAAPTQNHVSITELTPVLGMLPPTLALNCTAPVRLEFVNGATISFLDGSVDSANRIHPGIISAYSPTPFCVIAPASSYLDLVYTGNMWRVAGSSKTLEAIEVSSDSDGQWFLGHAEGCSNWLISQTIATGAELSVNTSGGTLANLIAPTAPDLLPPLVPTFPAGRWGGELFVRRSGGDAGAAVTLTLTFGLYNGATLTTILAVVAINVTSETAIKHVMRTFIPAFSASVTGLALKVAVSVMSSSVTPVTVYLSNPGATSVCTLHIPCLTYRATNTALGLIGRTSYAAGTSGATFTKDSRCTKIYYRGRAGGGGGGAACSTAEGCSGFGAAGGGGGQGGRIEGWLDMTGINTITGIRVGIGGLGGVATSSTAPNGSVGGDTAFTHNSLEYVAKGGTGGAGGYSHSQLPASILFMPGGAGVAGTRDVASGAPGAPGVRSDDVNACSAGAGGGEGGGAGNSTVSAGGAGAHGEGSGGGGALVIFGNRPEQNTYRDGGSADNGYLYFYEHAGTV
jgi:hypothetical protein